MYLPVAQRMSSHLQLYMEEKHFDFNLILIYDHWFHHPYTIVMHTKLPCQFVYFNFGIKRKSIISLLQLYNFRSMEWNLGNLRENWSLRWIFLSFSFKFLCKLFLGNSAFSPALMLRLKDTDITAVNYFKVQCGITTLLEEFTTKTKIFWMCNFNMKIWVINIIPSCNGTEVQKQGAVWKN